MRFPSITAHDLGLATPDKVFAAQSVQLVDASALIKTQVERFAFPTDIFDDLLILHPNKKVLRAAARHIELPPAPHIDRIGMDFLRIDMQVPRLTTAAAMTWGHLAQQNVVDLTDDQLDPYLLRKPIILNPSQLALCTSRGAILVRFERYGLGLGFLESTKNDTPNQGHVRSLYPRAFAHDLGQASALGNPL